MLGIGLYGSNGHQIQTALAESRLAELTATAGIPDDRLPAKLRKAGYRSFETLTELLEDPKVDLVSLCSPRRIDQAADAIRSLRAGKHVLAEKPCALSENDLDAILAAADETGLQFHEMAGTAFAHPYYAIRMLVQSGALGEVIQVIVEKSYPYHERRPQDEAVDGGLIAQNGIHALRMIEHVAGVSIESVDAVETTLGNPIEGGSLRMAASLVLGLENGGVASVSANYLNPTGTRVWGYESLKILGSRGMVELREGGNFIRVVIGEADLGALDVSAPDICWHEAIFRSILGLEAMPLTRKAELSLTRWAIRANAAAKSIRPSAGSPKSPGS